MKEFEKGLADGEEAGRAGAARGAVNGQGTAQSWW